MDKPGTSDPATADPTNYTNPQQVGSNTSGAWIRTVQRELNAATEDPGTFTITASDEWVSGTIALAPAACASPAPTITSIDPTSGPTAGGTSVTITGTNFVDGATVTFGGLAAIPVTFVDSTTLIATTAAHVAEVVDVVVTNPDVGRRDGRSFLTCHIRMIQCCQPHTEMRMGPKAPQSRLPAPRAIDQPTLVIV